MLETALSGQAKLSGILRALAAPLAVWSSRELPRTPERAWWVNGLGQMLCSDGDTPDIVKMCDLIPVEQRFEFARVLGDLPLVVSRAHVCVVDRGLAYKHAPDADLAAVLFYVVDVWLRHAAMLVSRGGDLATAADTAAAALLATKRQCVARWPLLGVLVDRVVELQPGLRVRVPTAQEKAEWACMQGFAPGELRDLLWCECVLEYRYESSWLARTAPIMQSPFGTEEDEQAGLTMADVVALLQVLMGWSLSSLCVLRSVDGLPWISVIDWLVPSAREFFRRRNFNPVLVRRVRARPTSENSLSTFQTWWSKFVDPSFSEPLRSAVRLHHHDKSYVTLYKMIELLPKKVRDSQQNAIRRIKHTANSPSAISPFLSRHGDSKEAGPKDPVGIDDAYTVVNRLLLEALEHP